MRDFNAICTHLACTVQYRPEKPDIFCSCHNGVFNLRGRNIAGPPSRPLESYQVVLRGEPGDEEIVVSMSKERKSRLYLKVYEWLHRRLPHLVDCRPIYVRQAMEAAGLVTKDAKVRHMWVPVEIVLAVKKTADLASGPS